MLRCVPRQCLLLLCLFTVSWGATRAKAQPPDPGDVFSGRVRNAGNSHPISGALISLSLDGTLVQTTRSGADGLFAVATHMLPASLPAGAKFTLIVQAADCIPVTQTVAGGSRAPLEIKLTESARLPVRVVDSAGKGLGDAAIDVTAYDARVLPQRRIQPGVAVKGVPLAAVGARTGTDGRAALRGLPNSGTVALSVHRAGYASAIYNIDTASRKPLTLPLSRETTITGRVVYGDAPKEPFVLPGALAKVQMWSSYSLWRQSDIAPDGTFQIRDIPSLAFTGESSLGINLEILMGNDEPRTGPGISVQWVKWGRNYNAVVTRDERGKKRWYLGYVEVGLSGLRYKEGEQIRHDIVLHPLARITGRTKTPEQPITVSYKDPRSWYEDWKVISDESGRFEIFAPAGDVVLNIDGRPVRGQLELKALKAHETREIEIP